MIHEGSLHESAVIRRAGEVLKAGKPAEFVSTHLCCYDKVCIHTGRAAPRGPLRSERLKERG